MSTALYWELPWEAKSHENSPHNEKKPAHSAGFFAVSVVLEESGVGCSQTGNTQHSQANIGSNLAAEE